MKTLYKFVSDDSGAVTVDWVVLTAAIVGIGMAVVTLISSGLKDGSNDINDNIATSGGFENSNVVLGLVGTGVLNADGTEIFRSPEGRLSLGAGGEPMTTADFEGDVRSSADSYAYSQTDPYSTTQDGVTGTAYDYTDTTITTSEVYDSTASGGAGDYVLQETGRTVQTGTVFVPDDTTIIR